MASNKKKIEYQARRVGLVLIVWLN